MSGKAERGIINTWDQLVSFGGDRIAIYYQAQELGRASRPAAFSVVRVVNGVEIKTDPKGAWYQYGRRTFYVSFPIVANRPAALAQAKAWADKNYGPREYVRNRHGDYVETEVNARCPIKPRQRAGEAKET